MIEIISIDQVNIGDILLAEGMEDKQVAVVTVKLIHRSESALFFHEYGSLDYTPDDPEHLVRIGTVNNPPIVRMVLKELGPVPISKGPHAWAFEPYIHKKS